MKRKNILLCISILAITIVACEKKGSPSTIGEMVTAEQLANIPEDDQSWNGKSVAIKGYPQFDRKLIKFGTKNYIRISTEPGGKKLINANISVTNADKNEGITIYGQKSRNFLKLSSEKLDITTAIFTTDDYQELPYGEFVFSGDMIYDQNGYYLDNISIHTP